MNSYGLILFSINASGWFDFWNRVWEFLKQVNWVQVIMYACIILCASSILVLSLSLVSENKLEKEYITNIKEESTNVRFYRIDGPKGSVRYFNLSDISNVKNVSIQEFYDSFPPKEEPRIKEWITDILDGKSVPQYLQTDIIVHREARQVPSFLKIARADPSKGMIHLESYLLRYEKENHGIGSSHFSTEGDFAQAVKANGVNSGITFCFALQPLPDANGSYPDPKATIPPEITRRFANAIAPYVKGNQKLIQASDSELIIANFDMLDSAQAINFSLKVVDGVNKVLEGSRKRREKAYEVRVGIVSNKDLLGDSDAILQEARRAASSAYDTANAISFYKKGTEDFNQEELVTYRSEVERIIYEKRLTYSYRPVYNVSKERVYGFLARAVPFNTSFATIEELKNYALRAKDDKNLFAAIAKNLVPRFVNERSSKVQKLFYPVSMSERNLLVEFFSHFKDAKAANLVFLFKENDIAVNLDAAGVERFLEIIQEIHEAGFEVAILLSGKNLLLDAKIYGVCDDFFVDFQETSEETNMDTKIRSELHALVEKLLHYGKPIIANSLMSWNALELIVTSGIDYLSSDIFAPYDSMFRPIYDKNLERVKALKGRK